MSIPIHCIPEASNAASAEELKACPHCGGAGREMERWANVSMPTARISCEEDCGAAVEVATDWGAKDMKGAMAKARTAWNRRAAPAEFERFATAAYELSTWAACINWRGKGNEKEWLDELREKIETVQSLHGNLRGSMGRSAA